MAGGYEGNEEEEATGDELEFVGNGVAEVLFVHQQEGGGSQEAYHGGTQALEDALNQRMVLVFEEELTDGEHQDERGQAHGKGGHETAPNAACGSEAYIGGAINADRAWRHLTDGDDVGKLLRGEPTMDSDYLGLDQGEHGVAASKAKQADLKECPKQR